MMFCLLLALLLLKLPLVELKLSSLEDVSVSATALSGARRDNGKETTLLELVTEVRVEIAGSLKLGDSLLDLLALGGLLESIILSDGDSVVRLVPLTVRGGIDLDNGVLDESLGTDELVVRGVVDDIQDTGAAGGG